MQVMVADGDESVAQGFARLTRAAGHRVQTATDAGQAMEHLERGNFGLAVLDANPLAIRGIELCRKLRARGIEVPVLVICARQDEQTELEAFRAGADDFIEKGVSPAIYSARAAALIRRNAPLYSRRYQLGGAQVEDGGRSLRYKSPDGPLESTKLLKLSRTEARVFNHLVANAHETVSRRELIAGCWDSPVGVSDDALSAVVHRLRVRLRGTGLFISSMRGRGVQLDTAPDVVKRSAKRTSVDELIQSKTG